MNKLGIILAAVAVLIAYKLYEIPVPEEAVDKYAMKKLFASRLLLSIKVYWSSKPLLLGTCLMKTPYFHQNTRFVEISE